jgi:hypothetical protein
MALTIPIIGATLLIGALLNNEKSPRSDISIRNDVIKNDIPNGANIYSSNAAAEADHEVLQRGIQNYKDAQDPAMTNILPPLFNTYSVNGNTNVLTYNSQDPSASYVNSNKMNKINELNRRINILETSSQPDVTNRPMFNTNVLHNKLIVSNEDDKTLANSDFIKDNDNSKSNLNPLTGLPYSVEHNNMVPFFGGNVKQNVEPLANVSKLDIYTGNKDTFQHKKEIKPFYTLMKQDINGTPSVTNNIDMSRYIQSNYKQGEKPFYEERVSAPIAGTIQNKIRNYGKSVDELRVASKPKLSYEGRTISGQFANIRGVHAPVNKNLTNTYYENTPDRWIKTTGAVTGEVARENYVTNFKDTKRQITSTDSYYGPGKSVSSLKEMQRTVNANDINNIPKTFDSIVQETNRQSLDADYIRNINTSFRSDDKYDYGKSTYTAYVTERQITGETNQFDLNVNKENTGNKMYYQDKAKGTIKETTLIHDNSGHIKTSFDKGSSLAYASGVQNWDAKATNKQVLVNNKYIGIASKEEGMGYSVANYVAKTTDKEMLSNNSYTGNGGNETLQNPSIYSTYKDPIKTRNVTSINYTGNSAPTTKYTMSRNDYNNAEINDRQESLLLNNRESGPNIYQIASGSDSQGQFKYTEKMALKEESSYRRLQDTEEFINPALSKVPYQIKDLGIFENKKETQSEEENNRLVSELYSVQLKDNPYFINGPNRI